MGRRPHSLPQDRPGGGGSSDPPAPDARRAHRRPIRYLRTGLMGDCFALPMSDATVRAAIAEAQARLAPTVDAIGRALHAAPVAGADETGIRVAGQLHWLHGRVTGTLTWRGGHRRRGKAAFENFAILTAFFGTLIHDGGRPYRDLRCPQGLCTPARAALCLRGMRPGLGQAHDRSAPRRPCPHHGASISVAPTPPSSPRQKRPIRLRRLRASADEPNRAAPPTSCVAGANTTTLCCAS